MSWGALPWWVYEMEQEQHLAKVTGAMDEEYHPRFTRAIPQYLIGLYETSKNENRTLGSRAAMYGG